MDRKNKPTPLTEKQCELCQDHKFQGTFQHCTLIYDQLSQYWTPTERASCLILSLNGSACYQCIDKLSTSAYFVHNYHERIKKFHENVKPNYRDVYLRNRCMICLHKRPATQHLSLRNQHKNEEMYRRFASILDFQVQEVPNTIRVVCLYCKDMLRQTEKLEMKLLEIEVERYRYLVDSIRNSCTEISQGFHKIFGFNHSYFEAILNKKKLLAVTKLQQKGLKSDKSKTDQNYQKVMKLLRYPGQKRSTKISASNIKKEAKPKNDETPKETVANNTKDLKEIQTQTLNVELNNLSNIELLFFGRKVNSQDSVNTSASPGRQSGVPSTRGDSLETLKNTKHIPRIMSTRYSSHNANDMALGPKTPKGRSASAPTPSKVSLVGRTPFTKSVKSPALTDRTQKQKIKSYAVPSKKKELVKNKGKESTEKKPSSPKITPNSSKVTPKLPAAQVLNSTKCDQVQKDVTLRDRLKELEEEIKQRYFTFQEERKSKAWNRKIQDYNVDKEEHVKKQKSLQTIVAAIRERQRKRREENERARKIELLAREYNPYVHVEDCQEINRGYDVFSVQDGVDIQYLIDQTQVKQPSKTSVSKSRNTSYSSIVEQLLRDDVSLQDMVNVQRDRVGYTVPESKPATKSPPANPSRGGSSIGSGGSNMSGAKRKESIQAGKTNNNDAQPKKVTSGTPTRPKAGPYIGRRVLASNTMENIPALIDDYDGNTKKSLKKPLARFTVPTR